MFALHLIAVWLLFNARVVAMRDADASNMFPSLDSTKTGIFDNANLRNAANVVHTLSVSSCKRESCQDVQQRID